MEGRSRRVVITGLGVVSPIGIGTLEFWDALVRGRNGVKRIERFDPEGLPTQFGGEVRGYQARKYLRKDQRKKLKLMARDIQLGVGAAWLALEDARLLEASLDRTRVGVEFGASMISSELADLAPSAQKSIVGSGRLDYKQWGKEAMSKMPPLWLLKYLPNMAACHVSILYDLEGPNNSITMAEASSVLAIGEAFRTIQRGAADVMLAGGCDSRLNPLALVKLCLQGDCSLRNDAPEQACRPFDLNRDGMVPAEGAAVAILEHWDHARRRGARIYGELVGFGAGCDARMRSDRPSHGHCFRIALVAALREAELGGADVGYYNANGMSTRHGDSSEAKALRLVFGDDARRIPVSAHKSNFGNAMAGGGALEFAAGVLALHHRLIPPTLNHTHPDPNCAIHLVTGSARELEKNCFLKANATRTGQAAALIVRKVES